MTYRTHNSHRGALLGLLLLLIMLLAFSLALIWVAAPSTAAVTNQPANETVDEPDPEPDYELTEQLGDLDVHSVEWNESIVLIEMSWRGSTPETVTLVEAFDDSGSSQQIGMQTIRLLPRASPGDRVELTMDLARTEAPVIVTTDSAFEDGRAIVLSPESDGIGEEWNVMYATPIGVVVGSALVGVLAYFRDNRWFGTPLGVLEALKRRGL